MASLIVRLLVIGCFVPAFIFPIYYSTLRWWSTLPGRAVMVMAVALALVLTIILLNVVFGVTLANWARVLIYGSMLIALWTKLGVLVWVSRRGYRPPEEADRNVLSEPVHPEN